MSMGVEMSDAQLECLMSEVDTDDSGNISFLEFATFVLLHGPQELEPQEASLAIFDMIDADHNGVLSVQEISQARLPYTIHAN